MQQDIEAIEAYALSNEKANDAFVTYLKQVNNEAIDALVLKINAEVAPQISCVDCGNCCKTLMVNIEEQEAEVAAKTLNMSLLEFKTKYVEQGGHELMLINTIPCSFLTGTVCSIYESRFSGCKQFPNLEMPQFTKRLFTTMMHYNRCPIIFNVMEQLKVETGFS